MTKLNKTFYSNNELYASEMNAIVAKLNEIIQNLPTSGSSSGGSSGGGSSITEQDIIDKVNAAKAELQSRIDELTNLVAQFDDGNTHIRTDEELLDLFKSAGKAVLVQYGVCDDAGHPYFDVLVNEDGIKPAAIIASINSGQSTVGISADKITLDGDVTVTDKLTALDAAVKDITVTDTATIKQAIVDDIETGNITVQGTLNYNRLVGNVKTITENNSTIPDDVTYVKTTANLLKLPANPLTGQTLYILAANATVVPSSGKAFLGGLVLSGTYDTVSGDTDTTIHYVYTWTLVEYGTEPKPYNTSGVNYLYDAQPNLAWGGAIHSYMYTGEMWVETTAMIPHTVTTTQKINGV